MDNVPENSQKRAVARVELEEPTVKECLERMEKIANKVREAKGLLAPDWVFRPLDRAYQLLTGEANSKVMLHFIAHGDYYHGRKEIPLNSMKEFIEFLEAHWHEVANESYYIQF